MWTRFRRLAAAASAAFTLLFAAVTFTPLVVWWSGWMGGPWDARMEGVMVVLGGDQIDPYTLGVSSYWRAVYASRAWRGGRFSRVVVSGKGVAPLMKDFLVSRGIPPAAILVENESSSTRENAVNTARLLAGDPAPKLLVTSDVHMFRARRALRNAGLAVTAFPFPYGRKLGNHARHRWGVFLELLAETSKTAYYGMRGWL